MREICLRIRAPPCRLRTCSGLSGSKRRALGDAAAPRAGCPQDRGCGGLAAEPIVVGLRSQAAPLGPGLREARRTSWACDFLFRSLQSFGCGGRRGWAEALTTHLPLDRHLDLEGSQVRSLLKPLSAFF